MKTASRPTRNRRRHSRRQLLLESLEGKLPLDGSGFDGNDCPPDLDMSSIDDQSIRIGDTLMIDLFNAGAIVSDVDADGTATGDTILLQLDPDDTPDGVTLADGMLQWTPSAEQDGLHEIIVIAIDGGNPPLADAESIFVEVRANHAPDLEPIPDEQLGVNELLEVTVNAADADGDDLTFLLDADGSPDGATLEQLDNNSAVIRWTPTAAFAGEAVPFTVLVVDDGSPTLSDSQAFRVQVMSVAASDDDYTISVDEVLSPASDVGVLANDLGDDGDPLMAFLVEDAASGTVQLEEDGSFVYTPEVGFRGIDTFVYRAEDGNGDESLATVTISVNSVPMPLPDAYITKEDQPLSIAASGVLVNDLDADGDSLMATVVQGPEHGDLEFNPDGSFIYTPDPEYSGIDAFTYAASDGVTNSAETTVTITVESVNDAPDASADSYDVNEDGILTVEAANGLLANDDDIEDDPLEAEVVNDPTDGALVWNADGSFVYTPNEHFNGIDSFTYDLSDGDRVSNATVTIMVNPINDAPEADTEFYNAEEGELLTIDAVAGVLTNDSDVDGDPLTAEFVTTTPNGTLNLQPDGSFTYTSNAGFSGDDSFTYRATDGQLDSSDIAVTITVTNTNAAPSGTPNNYTVLEDAVLMVDSDLGVLSNDLDPDGDTLNASVSSDVSNGNLTFASDGSFEYTPNANFSGTDEFRYRASDGAFTTAEILVTITVTAVNDAPVAVPEAYETTENEPLNIDVASGVLANDSDIETNQLSAARIDDANNGDLTLNPDGSFTYIPDTGFEGTDQFTYQATDGSDNSQTTTVSITVFDNNTFTVSAAATAGTVVGSVEADSVPVGDTVYEFAGSSLAPELELAPDDHLEGNPAASVVLVEYLDFQCPFCRAYHPVVADLEATFPEELLVVTRHLPLTNVHRNAFEAAVAAEAAGRQGMFDAMGDLLFDNQDLWGPLSDPTTSFVSYANQLGLNLDQFRADLEDEALADRVRRDFNVALSIGANSTPSFFINGQRLDRPAFEDFPGIIQTEADRFDEPFVINRRTGQIIVADSSLLGEGTQGTLMVNVKDSQGLDEMVEVTINVSSSAEGEASLVDQVFSE